MEKGTLEGELKKEEVLGTVEEESDSILLQALDGFLLVLSAEGEVVYSSENVSNFLGISQVDLMGQSLLEYTHPCDHDDLRHLTSQAGSPPNKGSEKELMEDRIFRSGFLRFKCTLTSKGRNVNIKSASYKVVKVSGRILPHLYLTGDDQSGSGCWTIVLCVPVPHPCGLSTPLDQHVFFSRHSLDMKFTYVDENVMLLSGYHPEELVGRSIYELHHALDSDLLSRSWKILHSKGQVETSRYRFLAKGGGYVWVISQATIISGPRDVKPEYVACLNYVIGGIERMGEILSEVQLGSLKSKGVSCGWKQPQKCIASAASTTIDEASVTKLSIPRHTSPATSPILSPSANKPHPVACTFRLFANRTEDMNEGYLTFLDDGLRATAFKEEPDDLSHLAPSGGYDFDLPSFHGLEDMLLCEGRSALSSLQNPSKCSLLKRRRESDVYGQGALVEKCLGIEKPGCPSASHLFLDEGLKVDSYSCLSPENFDLSGDGGKEVEEKVHRQYLEAIDFCSLENPVEYKASLLGSPEAGQCLSSEPPILSRTPEPPTPLLSQAASPLEQEKIPGHLVSPTSRPTTATSSLFAQLNDVIPSTSVMDLFSTADLKEEEMFEGDQFDLCAPYIPLMDEMLVLNPDDLLDSSTELNDPVLTPALDLQTDLDSANEEIARNVSEFLMFDDPQPSLGPSTDEETNVSPRSCDTPNVSPGHMSGQASAMLSPFLQESVQEEDKLCTALLKEYSRVMPEARAKNSHHLLLPLNLKRSRSPLAELSHKRVKTLSPFQPIPARQSASPPTLPHCDGVSPPPNAPTMQQLLEPQHSREGTNQSMNIHEVESMRKQLQILLSEKPALAVRTDLSKVLSKKGPLLTATINGGNKLESKGIPVHLRLISTYGSKSSASSSKPNMNTKFSLSKQKDFALDKAINVEVRHCKQEKLCGTGTASITHCSFKEEELKGGKFVSKGEQLLQNGPLTFESRQAPLHERTVFGQGKLLNRGNYSKERRTDGMFLISPDIAIPTLFDLTDLDYEVNAPADSQTLLQGEDLLNALDQP